MFRQISFFVGNSKYTTTMDLRFDDVAQAWKEDKRKHVKQSSYATYVQLLNAYIRPYFGASGGMSVNDDSIQDFVDLSVQKGLNVKTIKDAVIVLKMILRHGAKLGAWTYADARIQYPHQAAAGAGKMKIISAGNAAKLMAYLQENLSHKNLGILITMQTGIRIGEICALQWRDIDLREGVVCIRKTVFRIWLKDGKEKQNALVVGPPKTLESEREIPLSASLMKILRPLVKSARGDHFVISNSATPIEPRLYRQYFYRLLASLGIPRIKYHSLRHGFATRCIASGGDYKTVSAILGHASVSTTMNLYVHPGNKEKLRCIENMLRKTM